MQLSCTSSWVELYTEKTMKTGITCRNICLPNIQCIINISCVQSSLTRQRCWMVIFLVILFFSLSTYWIVVRTLITNYWIQAWPFSNAPTTVEFKLFSLFLFALLIRGFDYLFSITGDEIDRAKNRMEKRRVQWALLFKIEYITY